MADELLELLALLKDSMSTGKKGWEEFNESQQEKTELWQSIYDTIQEADPPISSCASKFQSVLVFKKVFDRSAVALQRIFEVNSLAPINSLLQTTEADAAQQTQEVQQKLDRLSKSIIDVSTLYFKELHSILAKVLRLDNGETKNLTETSTTGGSALSDSDSESTPCVKSEEVNEKTSKWVPVQKTKKERANLLNSRLDSAPMLRGSTGITRAPKIENELRRRSQSEPETSEQEKPKEIEKQSPEKETQEKQEKQSQNRMISTKRLFRGLEKTLLDPISPTRKKSEKNSTGIINSGTILPLLKQLEKKDEICFDFNPIAPDMPTVRYATVEKLIERLTLPNLATDKDFRRVFILTFPSFTTADEVLKLLMQRLVKSKNFQPEDYAQVVLRVVGAIKMWIEFYPKDFYPGTTIRVQTDDIVEHVIAEIIPEAAKLVQSVLPSDKEEVEVVTRSRATRTAPAIALDDFTVLQPNRICFSVLPALEVARQLTLMASSLFCNLKPQEFAHKNWCKEERNKLSPNIMKIIEQFNKISKWTTTEILRPIQAKERGKVMKKMIQVGMHFKDFNNFHGLMAILSGLQSSPVKRLNQTWAELNETESTFVSDVVDLMSFVGSYKKYRTALKSLKEQEYALPFIGIFLTDLVYIEDGNYSFVAPKKINFVKYTMIASVMQQILSHQMKYLFTELPAVTQWFSELQVMDEEEAYLLSMKLEPRNTNEALETLLLTEANLQKELNEIKVQNDSLAMREKEHSALIENLTAQLREQRRFLTTAQSHDQTLLKRYSVQLRDERREEVDYNLLVPSLDTTVAL